MVLQRCCRGCARFTPAQLYPTYLPTLPYPTLPYRTQLQLRNMGHGAAEVLQGLCAAHLLNLEFAVPVDAHMGKAGGAALHNRAALECSKVVVLRTASITDQQISDSVPSPIKRIFDVAQPNETCDKSRNCHTVATSVAAYAAPEHAIWHLH